MGGSWQIFINKTSLTIPFPYPASLFNPGEYRETKSGLLVPASAGPTLMKDWDVTAVRMPIAIFGSIELASEERPVLGVTLKIFRNGDPLITISERGITMMKRTGAATQFIANVTLEQSLQQPVRVSSRQELTVSVGITNESAKLQMNNSFSIALACAWGAEIVEPGTQIQGTIDYTDKDLTGHRIL